MNSDWKATGTQEFYFKCNVFMWVISGQTTAVYVHTYHLTALGIVLI